MLVAGGWDGPSRLSSTEVLVGDSPVWTMVSPLPFVLSHMSGATVGNTVYIAGTDRIKVVIFQSRIVEIVSD